MSLDIISSLKKTNRIDFENNCFTSCGIEYAIYATSMSHPRLREFLRLMPTVSIGMSYMDLIGFISNIFTKLTSGGDDFKATYFEVTNLIFNWKKSFQNHNSEKFLDENLDNILRFCALVCVAKGENCLVLSESVIQNKIDNWKKDMNMFDFFLLSKKLVPKLQQLYQDMQSQSGTVA